MLPARSGAQMTQDRHDTGIVDQNVQPPESVGKEGEQGIDLLCAGHIQRDCVGLNAFAFQGFGGGLRFGGLPRAEHHGDAPRAQLPGDFQAQPGACAGHQGDLIAVHGE